MGDDIDLEPKGQDWTVLEERGWRVGGGDESNRERQRLECSVHL